MDENQAPPPPPAGPPMLGRQTSSLAVALLVCGLLGWTLLPAIASIAAIITGHMARAEIRRNPDTMDGDGLAVAGLVLGWAMVVLSALGILLIILFFGGLLTFLAALGMSGALH